MSSRRSAFLGAVLIVAAGCSAPLGRSAATPAPAPIPPPPRTEDAPRPATGSAEWTLLSDQIARLAVDVNDLQNVVARLVAALRQREDEIRSLERRVGELSQPPPATIDSPPRGFLPSDTNAPSGGATPKIERVEDLYHAGLTRWQAGDGDSAILTFYELMANHPTHPLREEAQFLVAEILYVQKDLRGALAEFESLLAARPRSRRVPDTLLKIGLCHQGLRSPERARRAWERVTREYPGSAAAREARVLLRGARGG